MSVSSIAPGDQLIGGWPGLVGVLCCDIDCEVRRGREREHSQEPVSLTINNNQRTALHEVSLGRTDPGYLRDIVIIPCNVLTQ